MTHNLAVIDAINNSVATILFTPEGIVKDANLLFLDVVGFSLDALKGKHHRELCDSDYAQTSDYQKFWERLRSGEVISGTFPRNDINGNRLWLEATYFPIKKNGTVTEVMKIAAEVTEKKPNLTNKKPFLLPWINQWQLSSFTQMAQLSKPTVIFLAQLATP
ncbi:PAS domain S-box protein [Shewanella woodyi]|uniref:PAS domain S-box protein n=1 Tax=Shewanella woodyi TaxID=60961 RepID=UPI00374A22E7